MGFKPLEALSLLAKAEGAISRLSIQTPYGLIVEAASDGAVDVRLSDELSKHSPSEDRSASSFFYYIWPDYQTTFLWYKADWPGNPDEETVVELDEMRDRYAAPWVKAYDEWVDKYTLAFEAQECQLGSGKEPFPESAERTAWELEGMLLAVWLSMQPGVDGVEYDGASDGELSYLLQPKEPGKALGKFLLDLGKRE
jgi:hypothetical protein